jgi:hypothetical protein
LRNFVAVTFPGSAGAVSWLNGTRRRRWRFGRRGLVRLGNRTPLKETHRCAG